MFSYKAEFFFLQEVLIKTVLIEVAIDSKSTLILLNPFEGLTCLSAIILPSANVVTRLLEPKSVGDLNGGDGGIGSSSVEYQITVQFAWLVHAEFLGPLVLGQLKGHLYFAQGDVDRSGNLSLLLNLMRVPDINEGDGTSCLKSLQLLKIQFYAAIDPWDLGTGGCWTHGRGS